MSQQLCTPCLASLLIYYLCLALSHARNTGHAAVLETLPAVFFAIVDVFIFFVRSAGDSMLIIFVLFSFSLRLILNEIF